MVLEVQGLDQAKRKFVQLWGWHVSGFNQCKHCQDCLKGRREDQINLRMVDDDYRLTTDAPYFYLFAGGHAPRRESNVHLAVKPHPGAVASVGSLYNVTFTIRDAITLRVDRLPKDWMGLDDSFTTCRNFQFGVQTFGYKAGDHHRAPGDHSLLPEIPTFNS